MELEPARAAQKRPIQSRGVMRVQRGEVRLQRCLLSSSVTRVYIVYILEHVSSLPPCTRGGAISPIDSCASGKIFSVTHMMELYNICNIKFTSLHRKHNFTTLSKICKIFNESAKRRRRHG